MFAKVGAKHDPSLDILKMLVVFQRCDPVTESCIAQYLAKVQSVYARRLPFVMVYDTTDMADITMQCVVQQGTFMRRNDHLTKDLVYGCVIVLPPDKMHMKKWLDILFKLKKPACPVKFVGNREQAWEELELLVAARRAQAKNI